MPEGYEAYLVPTLFQPWADALVARLSPGRGIRAIDVATGPGTVARVLSRVIGRRGQIAACDSSPGMIEVALAKPEIPDGAPIAYTVAPAAPLPYPDQTFDVATCQQGLQFFPDARKALAEIRRVLVPGGRLVASVWCPPEDCTVFYGYIRTLRDAHQDELADLMTTPFPRLTADDLAGRAGEVGFSAVTVDDETRELVFAGGLDQALEALRAGPIGPALARLDAAAQAALRAAAERAFAPLVVDGAVRGPMRSWILTADA